MYCLPLEEYYIWFAWPIEEYYIQCSTLQIDLVGGGPPGSNYRFKESFMDDCDGDDIGNFGDFLIITDGNNDPGSDLTC